MSKTQAQADELRRANAGWNAGHWNVYNTSNRQIIKRFKEKKKRRR